MTKLTRRERIRARRRREQLRNRAILGVAGVIVVGVVGFLVWNTVRPAAGEGVEIGPNARDHIPEGQPAGPYSSDPPTSGAHYGTSLPARFYREDDLPSLPEFPEGYLVHNLEHGYVIFWYNCDLLDQAGCDTLTGQIQDLMDEFNGFKLIAFPWKSIDVPLVMTSWGQMQRFESFDRSLADRFIRTNRNRAPEPQAP